MAEHGVVSMMLVPPYAYNVLSVRRTQEKYSNRKGSGDGDGNII